MNYLGMYRPRGTLLHRMPAWTKVLMLIGWTVLSILVSDPVTAIGIAIAAILLLVSVLPPWRPTVKAMFGIVVIASAVAAYTAWRISVDQAMDMAADLIGIFSLSLAVTGSTRMSDMLDLAATAARPLSRVIPPAIPGIMFSIVIRVIPEVAQILGQSREALDARGLRRTPRALLTPTATRTVGFALLLGQALHARGIAEEAVPDKAQAVS